MQLSLMCRSARRGCNLAVSFTTQLDAQHATSLSRASHLLRRDLELHPEVTKKKRNRKKRIKHTQRQTKKQ